MGDKTWKCCKLTRRFTNTNKDGHCVRYCGQCPFTAFCLNFPLWILLLNVPSSFVKMRSCSSCLLSCHKCFRNSPQTGWIVSLGCKQIVWVMRQVGKDSAIKKEGGKLFLCLSEWSLDTKGTSLIMPPFVIRMVEAFFPNHYYFVLCLVWVKPIVNS